MSKSFETMACLGLALASSVASEAKPIAFADGTTVMLEYGAGTMKEAQVFYAPLYDLSVGGGYVEFDSSEIPTVERITYARVNFLARRWNLSDAQANIFLWGGLGGATGNRFSGTALAGNAGAQFDYETRRIYVSLKTDWQRAADFEHRVDTLQLGLAPYKHDYNGLATWFVYQTRDYTGGLYRGVEQALLLRLFKGGAWVEAGITNTHHLQAMIMVNF